MTHTARVLAGCHSRHSCPSSDTDDTPATEPVTVTVCGIERVRDAGKLIGLAIVELDLAGVVLTLQGVQVIRDPAGNVIVRAPQFRCANGQWRSAVVLPPGLAAGVSEAVLEHMEIRL